MSTAQANPDRGAPYAPPADSSSAPASRPVTGADPHTADRTRPIADADESRHASGDRHMSSHSWANGLDGALAPGSLPRVPVGGATAAPRPKTAAGSGLRASLSNVVDATAPLRRRAARALTKGWFALAPVARRWSQKVAPLSSRAATVDLVNAAAGVVATALAAVLIALAAQVQWHVGVLTAPLWLFMEIGRAHV